MPVLRVGLPMKELLAETRRFSDARGIRQRKPGQFANPEFARRGLDWAGEELLRGDWKPDLHPRDRAGKFARVAGGSHVRPGGQRGIAGPGGLRLPPGNGMPGTFGVPDSQSLYTRPDGTLEPARRVLHDKIVGEALAGHHPRAAPVATFLGGGTAAGKSTLGGGKPGSIVIDADEVKGKLPEYQHLKGQGDPRAAAFAHEESSDIAHEIQAKSISHRFDFTLDGTGDSKYEKMLGKVQAAKSAGYKVSAKYVTCDTGEAVRRARARAAQTGRAVPKATIESIHSAVSDTLSKLIANDDFDSLELWDTNGPEPLLVGSKPDGGKWKVKDEQAWQRFLAKAQPQQTAA